MTSELAARVDASSASPSAGERHVVQFYQNDRFLAETVAKFVGSGLVAGEPVLVIATPAHRDKFTAELRARAVDVDRACVSGQLVMLDARETLGRFMVDGSPDWDRFRFTIGSLIDQVRRDAGATRVRAYGEMVDLLWRDGARDAAIRLEQLWNDLGRVYQFELLCAYVLDHFFKEGDRAQFEKICALHSHSRPTERFVGIEDEAGRMQEVSSLQQRALALQNEVERRKKVESELRAAQKRLTDFVENAVVPLHWVAGDGTILWANKAELDMLGYTADEYVGRHIAEFHADPDIITDILGRLSCQQTLREYPARLRAKDGSIRYVLIDSNVLVEDGKVVHTRCFTRDITDRKLAEENAQHKETLLRDYTSKHAAEEKLRQSENRMRLLIDSIRDYAIFMLDAGGHVSTWNPGAERFKGYQAHEIIGHHFSEFYPEVDVKAGKCEMELRVAAETGRFEDEGWRVRKDGSQFWANVVISAVRDDDGTLVGFAKVTRDLTERVRAEHERAQLLAAEQANRAKDEFLAMLGHELRNPLAPIVTALQLMKLRGESTPSKEHVIIERQVQHVVRLVDDLLDVSRITQGKIELKRETFELATVVAKAVEIASPLLEQRRHDLVVEVPRTGMMLHADAVRLAQVLANLLTNAAKYTDVEGRIEVRAWRDGHEVVVQVKDNGMGVKPELLPKLFDLFVQGPRSADRAEGGLGIGLTLVRSLVQMHGGTVVALSDGPGKGSAFVVRLPAAPPEVLAAVEDEKAKQVAPAKSVTPRRVLVVDDNVDAASLLSELCETMGHDVKMAHDGPQALAALDGFSPDIAVLDIGLPVMDGYELAKRIREKLGPSCRLVALTGYGQEHDRRRSAESGFAAHLVKPVDPKRVLDLIDSDV